MYYVMEVVQNTDYFENQLLTISSNLNNPAVNQLISDMVTWARALENGATTIPPADSLPPKTRPIPESDKFRDSITLLDNTIGQALQTALMNFLNYIVTLENSAT